MTTKDIREGDVVEVLLYSQTDLKWHHRVASVVKVEITDKSRFPFQVRFHGTPDARPLWVHGDEIITNYSRAIYPPGTPEYATYVAALSRALAEPDAWVDTLTDE